MDGEWTVAFDIETIDAPVPAGTDRDLENSAHVELFCVGVGAAPIESSASKSTTAARSTTDTNSAADTSSTAARSTTDTNSAADTNSTRVATVDAGAIEHAVFFREDRSATAELELIRRVVDWLSAYEPTSVLTYNGEYFDCHHLRGRARIAADAAGTDGSVADSVASFLDATAHHDLFVEVREPYEQVNGRWPRFEDACAALDVPVERTPLAEYEFGDVDLAAARSTRDATKPYLVGADVPTLGPRYLRLREADATKTRTFADLEAMLAHYASTDVVPLFELDARRPFEAAFGIDVEAD